MQEVKGNQFYYELLWTKGFVSTAAMCSHRFLYMIHADCSIQKILPVHHEITSHRAWAVINQCNQSASINLAKVRRISNLGVCTIWITAEDSGQDAVIHFDDPVIKVHNIKPMVLCTGGRKRQGCLSTAAKNRWQKRGRWSSISRAYLSLHISFSLRSTTIQFWRRQQCFIPPHTWGVQTDNKWTPAAAMESARSRQACPTALQLATVKLQRDSSCHIKWRTED